MWVVVFKVLGKLKEEISGDEMFVFVVIRFLLRVFFEVIIWRLWSGIFGR